MKMTDKTSSQLMRDIVINSIAKAAEKDKDILFISADLGAKALDSFRRDFPNQFIHAGISEQNMVDLASGLALSGKKVFLYAMAPFITARCFEQLKCVIASMGLPVTLISVGVGLGYDHATLTHFTPEDIACMRSLNGIEVSTPSDGESAEAIIEQALDELEGLEETYQLLVKELSKKGNQKQIIAGMISNYQQRLQILENVMHQIELVKNPKILKDENFI